MNQQFTSLFTRVGRIQFIVLGLIASGMIFFGQYFITNIYATSEYADAYVVALLLILPAMIPLIQNVGIEIQRSVNKHQFRSIIYLFMAVVNTIISIPLAFLYGPAGAALGTAISLLVANGLIMNWYYLKALGIGIGTFWKSIASLAKGLIVPVVLGVFIMCKVTFHGLLDFAIWVFIYTVVYAVSFWLLGMNDSEKQLVIKPLHKVLRHKR